MLLFAFTAFSYCELASTFNVLTWRVMPCLQVVPGLLACLVWFLCSQAKINVPARVPADWSPSLPIVLPLPVEVPLPRVVMLLA